MTNQVGRYIVLEGPEGAGKSTQLEELYRRLTKAGFSAKIFREPDSLSDLTARNIRRLTQNPNYPMNSRTEVLLYNAARSQSLEIIKQNLAQGIYCLVDRSYLTTLAVQYYGRSNIDNYESINEIINFAIDGIEPDLCIILDAPVNVLQSRLKSRYSIERFDSLDASFLEKVRSGYLWEAHKRQLPIIFSVESVEQTAQAIWDKVVPVLDRNFKVKNTDQDQSLSVAPPILNDMVIVENTKEKPLITEINNNKVITKAGKDLLNEYLSDSNGDVYAFNGNLSSPIIAASMARLSRRNDDLRLILLDEFINNKGKENNLLKRVISEYGDDSVQQLANLHFVVENASNLLSKKLEWGRLGSYLEQSTRYSNFDKKNVDGTFKFYIPQNLKPAIKKKYISTMNIIFNRYSEILPKITNYLERSSSVLKKDRDKAWKNAIKAQACDLARTILPVATQSTVGLFMSAQAVENLIQRLASDSLPEANLIGQKILNEARKIMPVFLERADMPDRGGAKIAYLANTTKAMKLLTENLIGTKYEDHQFENVSLVSYSPKNELEIIPDLLYEHSSLSLEKLKIITSNWSYDQKTSVFKTYIGERLNRRQKPGRALEKINYHFDIMCDYGIFRDIQRHRMVNDLEWQTLTPRYGFNTPSIIEQAGLTDFYEKNFYDSLDLNSLLVEAGYSIEAQYAVLLGHKMRFKVSYNARQAFHIHELRTTPQGHPGYRKLVLEMHQKIKDVHPLIADAMKFVNQSEDPELTRLSAERYAQFKKLSAELKNK